jgi:hypothetical protein
VLSLRGPGRRFGDSRGRPTTILIPRRRRPIDRLLACLLAVAATRQSPLVGGRGRGAVAQSDCVTLFLSVSRVSRSCSSSSQLAQPHTRTKPPPALVGGPDRLTQLRGRKSSRGLARRARHRRRAMTNGMSQRAGAAPSSSRPSSGATPRSLHNAARRNQQPQQLDNNTYTRGANHTEELSLAFLASSPSSSSSPFVLLSKGPSRHSSSSSQASARETRAALTGSRIYSDPTGRSRTLPPSRAVSSCALLPVCARRPGAANCSPRPPGRLARRRRRDKFSTPAFQ